MFLCFVECGEGLNNKQMRQMLPMFRAGKSYMPIEFHKNNTSAYGFIEAEYYGKYDYEPDFIAKQIEDVCDDWDLESENFEYSTPDGETFYMNFCSDKIPYLRDDMRRSHLYDESLAKKTFINWQCSDYWLDTCDIPYSCKDLSKFFYITGHDNIICTCNIAGYEKGQFYKVHERYNGFRVDIGDNRKWYRADYDNDTESEFFTALTDKEAIAEAMSMDTVNYVDIGEVKRSLVQLFEVDSNSECFDDMRQVWG
jgi:hypothetical protein